MKEKNVIIFSSYIKRLFAYLIDWYLSGMLASLSIIIIDLIYCRKVLVTGITIVLPESLPYNYIVLENFIVLLLLFCYFVIIPYLSSGNYPKTIGQKFTKIALANEDGTPVNLVTLIKRNFLIFVVIGQSINCYYLYCRQLLEYSNININVEIIQYSSLAVMTIAIAYSFINSKRQTIYDKLTKTIIVDTRK